MGKLTDSEQKLLAKVIEVAGDDESRIRDGITTALAGIDKWHGRQYLWHLLKTKATAKIRRAKKKAGERVMHPNRAPQQIERPQFALTP